MEARNQELPSCPEKWADVEPVRMRLWHQAIGAIGEC